jgi:hypothetical protein
MRDVEQQAGVGRIGDAREVVEDVQVSGVDVCRRILRKHLESARFAQLADVVRERSRRRFREHRGQQDAVAAIAGTDVPQACVAAEPGGAEVARDLARGSDPRVVEIVAFFEIQIEEVVRGRRAGVHPGTRRFVGAALEIDADFEELQQIGAIAAQRERVEPVRRRAELRRDAEAQSWQRSNARRERGSRVVGFG